MIHFRGSTTHPSLEVGDFLVREGIGLGDDRNQVHLGVQLTHELDVDGLEPVKGCQGEHCNTLLPQTTHE